jgi:hydrogenase maturation protein HypF
MLPYTPLHALFLDHLPLVVATSSNRKDAPIMKDEEEGLAELCDIILTHDRPIHMRADDSVVKAAAGTPLFVRRARGFVPYPQPVPASLRSRRCLLALGGELKDTLSLYKNGYVITSQFLGDLDDHRNHTYFEETVRHLLDLFDARPEAVVTDLHPDFHTTRSAERLKIPHLRVQHHFAHVLAPLLEHGWDPGRRVLGVAWDGYGYGEDGFAWGGEFLIADYSSYERYAHFANVPLPGGDAAARQPWRMALAYLRDAFSKDLPDLKPLRAIGGRRIRGVLEMMGQGLNSPPTSSCGRLFDAVSFLAGVAPAEMEFEAEAAMRFESLAGGRAGPAYPFELRAVARPLQVGFGPLIRAVVDDLGKGAAPAIVAARFHETLARVVLSVAERARRERRIDTVVLAGGVFLNRRLLVRATGLLERRGFRVLRSGRYSPNDESLSLGQIAYALGRLKRARRSAFA